MTTHRFRVVLVGLATMLVIAWTQSPQRERVQPNSQAWVYRVDPVPGREEWLSTYAEHLTNAIMRRNADRNERLLNQRAAEGWELAAVGTSNFYFRRPR